MERLESPTAGSGREELKLFTSAVLSATGCDFSEYSDKSLRRRLQRLLEEVQFRRASASIARRGELRGTSGE